MSVTSVEENIKAQLKNRKNDHVMVVEGMSKLMTHKVTTVQSSIFHIDGHRWKLIVRPAGKDGTSDYLSFYLRIKDKKSLQKQTGGSNWEVKCTVTLRAIPQTGRNNCHSIEYLDVCYNEKQAIYGEEEFIDHVNLKKKFLLNDKVVLCAEVTNVQSNCAVTPIPRTMGTAERFILNEVSPNNSKFTWKITQFSSFEGEHHSSYEFTVGPRRWQLVMNPKGNSAAKGKAMSLYLHATDYINVGLKAKTVAVYKLRVLDQFNRKHYEPTKSDLFHYDDKNRSSYSFDDKFVELDLLNNPCRGFLVNDHIYLAVQFLLVSSNEYF